MKTKRNNANGPCLAMGKIKFFKQKNIKISNFEQKEVYLKRKLRIRTIMIQEENMRTSSKDFKN